MQREQGVIWVDSGEWRQAGKERFALYTVYIQIQSVPYMERGTKEIFVYKLPMCVLTSSAACVCILLFLCVYVHKCWSVCDSVSVYVVVVYLL